MVSDGSATLSTRIAIAITGRGGHGCRGCPLRRTVGEGSYLTTGGRFLRKVVTRYRSTSVSPLTPSTTTLRS